MIVKYGLAVDGGMQVSENKAVSRDLEKEGAGWLSLILIMFLFPALFFLCVFFPIWLGIASPY